MKLYIVCVNPILRSAYSNFHVFESKGKPAIFKRKKDAESYIRHEVKPFWGTGLAATIHEWHTDNAASYEPKRLPAPRKKSKAKGRLATRGY